MSDKPRIVDMLSKKFLDSGDNFVYEGRWAPLMLTRACSVHPTLEPVGITIGRRSDFVGENEPEMYCVFSLEEALRELIRDDVEYIAIEDFPIPCDEYDNPKPNKIIIKKGENGKFDVEIVG